MVNSALLRGVARSTREFRGVYPRGAIVRRRISELIFAGTANRPGLKGREKHVGEMDELLVGSATASSALNSRPPLAIARIAPADTETHSGQ